MKEKMQMNPWLSMWVHPKKTIREIVSKDPKYRFVILSFIYGFPWIFHMAQAFLLGKYYAFSTIIITTFILAIPFGYIMLSFSTAILLWTGKLIKGKSTFYPLRAAVSWANVPNTVNIIIWAITLFVLGTYAFYPTTAPIESMNYMTPYLQGVFVVQLVIAIWSFFLLLFGIAEVQGFSAWMAFLNAILAFILTSIIIFALLWAVSVIMTWG